MSPKYRIVLFFIIAVIIWRCFQFFSLTNRTLKTNNQNQFSLLEPTKIKVTVYYEALCSDSRSFVLKQLVPAYETLERFMDLELIPFGKASYVETEENILFQCQHGSIECIANLVHSCVIDQVTDPKTQLKYVSCMINDNMLPSEIGEKCGTELGMSYSPIAECATGRKGQILLKKHGIRTKAVSPTISFIPTIELDDSQKVPLAYILKDFKKEFCNLLPIKHNECL